MHQFWGVSALKLCIGSIMAIGVNVRFYGRLSKCNCQEVCPTICAISAEIQPCKGNYYRKNMKE